MATAALNAHQRFAIDLAIRFAERRTRMEFSVYIGSARGAPRTTAQALHSALVAPAKSVLFMIDPELRLVEMVSGRDATRFICDGCAEAIIERASPEFSGRGIAAGVVHVVRAMAEGCFEWCQRGATLSSDGCPPRRRVLGT
jgi:hypothetical protein